MEYSICHSILLQVDALEGELSTVQITPDAHNVQDQLGHAPPTVSSKGEPSKVKTSKSKLSLWRKKVTKSAPVPNVTIINFSRSNSVKRDRTIEPPHSLQQQGAIAVKRPKDHNYTFTPDPDLLPECILPDVESTPSSDDNLTDDEEPEPPDEDITLTQVKYS